MLFSISKVGMYNSSCQNDNDCLKNAECTLNEQNANRTEKICKCSTKERTIFKPDKEPYYQCSKEKCNKKNFFFCKRLSLTIF